MIYVIPSVLLSFLPDYCHSFRGFVIPSLLVSFLLNTKEKYNLSALTIELKYLQILTTSKSFPYQKGEKNGHRRWPYMRVYLKVDLTEVFLLFFLSICLLSNWQFSCFPKYSISGSEITMPNGTCKPIYSNQISPHLLMGLIQSPC